MTNCPLTYNAESNRWTCPNCGWSYSPRHPEKVDATKPPHRNCPASEDPAVRARLAAERLTLVGNQLHDLIAEMFGEAARLGCGCNEWIAKMNVWGPNGCLEHMTAIIDRLVDQITKHEWDTEIPAMVKLARVGLKIPLGETVIRWRCQALVEEAIRRAEAARLADGRGAI